MPQEILVTKRNGKKEPLDINKLHKVVSYACDGLTGVSASEVEIKSQIQFYSGIKSCDIQETLIKAASVLITEETPNYQYVAGRLINYKLRKDVYGDYNPIPLYDHVQNVIDLGFYTSELNDWYTKDDFEKMEMFLDHSRDESLTYVGMEQFRGKYLVKNRVTGDIHETPQMLYILIAATLFHSYPKETRMKYVKDYYDMTSKHIISLPSPVMAGVRTTQKQFSSCVLIECGDSLDSIGATSNSILKYVAQKAGIGINAGRLRALGSPIRNGDAYHTGVIPFLKLFQASVGSCSQGGIRKGSATTYFPIWHLEIEDLVVLKNNKGVEENRVRQMDYGIQISKLFYERLVKNQDVTLFCPNDVPELYEVFFSNQDEFKRLYEIAEKKTGIRKKRIKAQELFSAILNERTDTGRIYIMNVDNCNDHGSFKPEVAPIKQSNLCCEITLPTKAMGYDDSLIALCTLSAINWGKIDSPEDFKKPCELAVRALDALLSYQDFPVEAARLHTEYYRPLGVGITNLAYFMAKNGLDYNGNQETYDTIDEFAEAWSYYLIKASVDLAKEFGPCVASHHTKYSEGILPIDTYKKKEIDKLVSRKSEMDWDSLREELKKWGTRNSTLMALMPAETSSQISNSTNGIEPPRGYISIKQSKDGTLAQVVPGYPRFRKKYQLLWDIESPEGYLNICGILQKYIDQAISVNTSYNPEFYPNNKIPMSVLMSHLIKHYQLGGKTLYYNNTYDGATDEMKIEVLPKDSNVVNIKKSPVTEEHGCADGGCIL